MWEQACAENKDENRGESTPICPASNDARHWEDSFVQLPKDSLIPREQAVTDGLIAQCQRVSSEWTDRLVRAIRKIWPSKQQHPINPLPEAHFSAMGIFRQLRAIIPHRGSSQEATEGVADYRSCSRENISERHSFIGAVISTCTEPDRPDSVFSATRNISNLPGDIGRSS